MFVLDHINKVFTSAFLIHLKMTIVSSKRSEVGRPLAKPGGVVIWPCESNLHAKYLGHYNVCCFCMFIGICNCSLEKINSAICNSICSSQVLHPP